MHTERRSITFLLGNVFAWASASVAANIALGKQIYDMTGRELDLGLLGLVEFAPAAVLVLVSGAVADRFDRRRVAAVACAGELVAALGLAAYASTDPTSIVPIFALVLLFGIARAFAAPAARALPADIVAPSRLSWLIPRTSAAWQMAIIVGPVVGGFLYAFDPVYAYLGVAALLLVAAVSVTLVEIRTARPAGPAVDQALPTGADALALPEPARGGIRDALEGLRLIRRRPVLLGAISLDLFAVLFGGAVALLPAIADQRLGVGAVGLGWLRAAGGIGAAVVTLALARRPLGRRIGRTLLTAVAVFGVFTVVLGVTRSFAVAFVAMAVLSGADAISVFIRATLVPLATPAKARGRVLAVENVFIGASNELGAFESGVVGQILGPAGAVVTGGAATLLVAGAWWTFFPDLRDLDAFPTGADDSDASVGQPTV